MPSSSRRRGRQASAISELAIMEVDEAFSFFTRNEAPPGDSDAAEGDDTEDEPSRSPDRVK
ncbi:MAG: hypothetical protein H0V07_00155 [Propionibacteriales bacterium]|nr:hypothetical protein [Propionibacteriales bacterium]